MTVSQEHGLGPLRSPGLLVITAVIAGGTFAVTLFAAGLLLPLAATDVWTMASAPAGGGTAWGPLTAVQYELVGIHAPSGTTAQAFTWVMTGTVAGSSLGTRLGGLLIEDSGVGGVLTPAAVGGSLAALVAWFGGRRPLMARPGGRPA
ncbi:hypothetical protein ACFWUZ_10330 [Streptomyces sp. NPDC058646]|uniref:hypothetical protein n=1 Tax=Streptomyces sp. NPDC058646 TaxID=3346574 RepID=UPI003656399E